MLASVAIFAMALIGCESTANTNMKTNASNANSNVGVVVNNNSNATMPVNNTAMNSNRWNSNISKEEYEKGRADYEKDKGTSVIGTGASDSWIWFKTRSALATTADLRESTINVDVTNDVITLKGTVGTAEQKKKAVEVAKGIDGQKGVKDELMVQKGDSMTNQMMNGNSNGAKPANANAAHK